MASNRACFVLEIPVDQCGRLEAGALGDPFDGSAAETMLGHDVQGRIDNLRASAALGGSSAAVA